MGIFDNDKPTEFTNETGSSTRDTNLTYASGNEESAQFHYQEAKRLLFKAEDCMKDGTITTSTADTYIRMAQMHMHIWADLKSIEVSGHMRNDITNWSKETVTANSPSYTSP